MQLVAEDYTSFLSSSILPRLRSGRLDLVYVAAVTMPVVQDYGEFPPLHRHRCAPLNQILTAVLRLALEQCVKKYTDVGSARARRRPRTGLTARPCPQ